jgi:predicted dienelactone hydrolase
MPYQTEDGVARPVTVTHDARVRALVLLAPAVPWFAADGALADVDLPILLRTAEHDEITPAMHTDYVARGVKDPSRVEARVVNGAGHFSFMSPFPASMVRPEFLPSQDPPGFDRPAYVPVLQAEVLEFFERHLNREAR